MERQFVVFGLALFLVVAAETAESPKASLNNTDVGADLLAPGADSTIGNTDGAATPGAGNNDVVEAPIGEPGAEGATTSMPAEPPKAAASAIQFSVLAVVAAVAVFFF